MVLLGASSCSCTSLALPPNKYPCSDPCKALFSSGLALELCLASSAPLLPLPVAQELPPIPSFPSGCPSQVEQVMAAGSSLVFAQHTAPIPAVSLIWDTTKRK